MFTRQRVKTVLFVLGLTFLAPMAACSRLPQGTAAGTRKLHVTSSGLAEALVGQVWYPAARGSRERKVFYSSMAWGHAAVDAPLLAGSGKRPVVLLTHGWRGTRFDLSWIGEALARQGYVAAAINMPDSDATSFQNAQAPKVWFRAKLQRQLLDALAHEPALAAVADTDRVAVIGHSAGGSTALMLGGAKLDPERFAETFPEAAPVVDGPWADARVQALVTLNPGTGPAFAPEGLSHVHVPLLVLSGTGDHVAPEAENAGFYAHNVENARWVRFRDVDHYSFMPVCSPYGMLRGFGACIESHPNVDRAYVHRTSLRLISQFLGEVLPLQPASAAPAQVAPLPLFSPLAARRLAAPRRTSGIYHQ